MRRSSRINQDGKKRSEQQSNAERTGKKAKGHEKNENNDPQQPGNPA